MRLIKPLTVKRCYTKHKDAAGWLKAWMVTAKAAKWESFDDVRKTYKQVSTANVESKGVVTIFKAKGNNYRLIVAIHYNTQRIYIRDFMTHEEYNNQLWKKRH